MAKNIGETIRDGIIGLGTGILIAVELPMAIVKDAIGKVTGKKNEEKKEDTKVTVKEIDINKLDEKTREQIWRMYNKKNGIENEGDMSYKNKKSHNGINYSRYIASWRREGGDINGYLFERWLREQEQLTDEEIQDIMFLIDNGKMELERSAREFMERNKN